MDETSKLSDEALVKHIISVDSEAYRHIVKRYESKLLRYAIRFISDEAAAKDVVQTAFIKAFKNLNSFDLKRAFGTWIYRITHNEAINYLKRNHKLNRFGGIEVWERILPASPSIEETTISAETNANIAKHVDKLPPYYKEPLVLYYFEEKSYEEISDILRIPINTVSSRISRAKKQMREYIEK